jgi:hypothetical protein
MQIKIKSARVQAECLGLVAPVLNSKRAAFMVAIKHEGCDNASFYLTDNEGWLGTDVTAMVLKACPYPAPTVKKSFFRKCVDKAVSVYENVATNAVGYVAGITLVTASFS